MLGRKQARCHYLLLRKSKTDWSGETGAEGEVSAILESHFAHESCVSFLLCLKGQIGEVAAACGRLTEAERHLALPGLAGLPHSGRLKRSGKNASAGRLRWEQKETRRIFRV